MRATVSSSLSKRLDKLAVLNRQDRISIPGGVIFYGSEERIFAALAECPEGRKGRYLLVPPILSIDEWENEALAAQESLVRETSEWLGPPVINTARDPDDISHRYKPDKFMVQK